MFSEKSLFPYICNAKHKNNMKTNDNEKFVRPDALNEEFKTKEVKKPVKNLAVKVDEPENNQAKHWF